MEAKDGKIERQTQWVGKPWIVVGDNGNGDGDGKMTMMIRRGNNGAEEVKADAGQRVSKSKSE